MTRHITIRGTVEGLPYLGEARHRLLVIYPNLEIEIAGNDFIISNMPEAEAEAISQAVRDQIIRSRYSAQSSSLRQKLYSRLLGE